MGEALVPSNGEAPLMLTDDVEAAGAPDAPAMNSKNSAEKARSQQRRDKKTSARRFPVKDTIVCHIPLHVTADLGIALRRTRIKRVKKLRSLFPQLVVAVSSNATTARQDGEAQHDDEDEDSDGDGEKDKDLNEEGAPKQTKTSKKTSDGRDLLLKGASSLVPRREQYGNVLDYLEAKYVRGLMIPDLDEQMKQQQLAGDDVSHLTAGDDDDDSSDGPGSIYSEWSMMDDALLRTEVAEQVKASSTYGTTKIEAQARLAKIERIKAKQQQQQNKDDTGSNKDMTDVSDIDEDQDDDDAFFVNVGNLEMDEGYEDADVAEIDYEELEKKSGKEKAGKKKRKRKKVDASSEGGSATKKKRKKATDSTNKEKTKQNATTETQPTKTKKVKTQKSTDDGSKVVKKKNKSLVKKPKPDVVPDKLVEKEEEAEKLADHSSSDSSDEQEEEDISPQEQAELKAAKKASEKKMKEVKNLYDKCVLAIQQMTEEHLPRKIKGKIKVALTVPDNKKAGDTVKFSNPHVPDQMLRVLIPKGCVPGATFNVSVPRPDTRQNKSTVNKFSREAQELLTEYSETYDSWCQVEEAYKNLLPYKGAKKKKFKQTAQRLKKFDEMVDVFPNKELATPVDAVFLRLVVRRSRCNAKKKLQRTQLILETSSSPITPKNTGNALADPEEPPHDLELHVPGKGTHFPTIPFNLSDFSRDK